MSKPKTVPNTEQWVETVVHNDTPEQAQQREALRRRKLNAPKVVKNENQNYELVEPEELKRFEQILNTMGCLDQDIVNGMINHLMNLAGEDKINQQLAMMRAFAPKDATEGMLVLQLVTAQHLRLEFAKRAFWKEQSREQVDAQINRSTKAMNTFTRLFDTLTRYRTQGKQVIQVQHVTVNDGGQAIVGNVQAGGGGGHAKPGQ